LGNTQDVALRSWLKTNGMKADAQGGGDVSIVPQENAQTLETFKSGAISGAWVPEPWATRLVQEGSGKILVDEATLWPEGRYVTTHLIVRTAFLKEHPDTVARLLEGHVAATAFLNQSPAEGRTLVNQAIGKLTGKSLPAPLIDAAWKNLTFTNDPVASSLRKGALDAQGAGLLPNVKLDGIYDLVPLNTILVRLGQPEVKS
jgi:NitT/TauT family transport system substrate-binding protein